MRKLRVGVLASGRGSNLAAILDASRSGRLDAEVVAVLSDVPDAPALGRAREAGVPAVHVPPGPFRTKLTPEAEAEFAAALERHGAEVVALAGFMRILHGTFLGRFEGRVVNIHPSLLPAFPGLRAQEQALAYGVRWAGATVHFVSAGVDAGPVILQAVVQVLPDDTAETLSARILEEEHRIYPEALELIAEGRIVVEGGRRVRVLPRGGGSGRP